MISVRLAIVGNGGDYVSTLSESLRHRLGSEA